MDGQYRRRHHHCATSSLLDFDDDKDVGDGDDAPAVVADSAVPPGDTIVAGGADCDMAKYRQHDME